MNFRGRDTDKSTVEPAVVTGRPHVHKPPLAVAMPRDGRRIRIVTPGWETFSGDYGSQWFNNGVSNLRLTEVEIDRVASQLHCVDLETGLQLGPQQRIIDAKPQKMPVVEKLAVAPDPAKSDAEALRKVQVEERGNQRIYNQEQLEALVDDKGIQGLREIAAIYQVKGRAIPELIASILRAQSNELDRRNGVPQVALKK